MTSWRGSKTRITWSTSSGPANILYSQKQIGRMVCRVSRRGRAMKCNTKLQEVKICNLVNKTNLVQQVGFIYKIIQRCMVNKTKQKKKAENVYSSFLPHTIFAILHPSLFRSTVRTDTKLRSHTFQRQWN